MATTQLSEAYALQKTKSGPERSPDISESKKYVKVIDVNGGDYKSGYVDFDLTNQLVGSQGWADLGDAYLTVPVAITAQSSGALPTLPKQFSRFLVVPKANVMNWIDSFSIEVNGQTVVNESSFKWEHNNIRTILQTSQSEILKHGDERFLCGGVDSWTSLGYSKVGGPFGDGHYNTRTDDPAATDQTEFQNATNTIYNDAFLQRTARLTPMSSNTAAQTTVGAFNWPALGKSGSVTKQVLRQSARGVYQEWPAPTADNNRICGEWFLPLHIKLRHLHDLFDKIPLCQNLQLKLRIRFNSGKFTVAYGDVSTQSLDSIDMIGSVCPIMYNNCIESAKTSEGAPVVASGTKVTVHFGVCGNELTTRERVGEYLPYNRCYTTVPFYQLSPQHESALLSNPSRVVEFEDCFAHVIKGKAGEGVQDAPINQEFVEMIGGAHRRVRWVSVTPYVNSSKDYWSKAGLTAQQWQSPFDSAPFSNAMPGGQITRFNVLLGNESVFGKDVDYDEEMFHHEVSKIFALNGDSSSVINNGLLSLSQWAHAKRFLIADCSRVSTNNGDAPVSVMVKGTNSCCMGMDPLVVIAKGSKFRLDIATGEVSDVQI